MGAFVLSIVLGLLVWYVGLPSVRPREAPATANGFIAAEYGADAGPTFLWLTTLKPLDPAERQDVVTLRITTSAVDASKITILLGGDLASTVSCYGDGATVDPQTLDFQQLSSDLQDLAVNRYRFSPAAGSFSGTEGAQVRSADDARQIASGLAYRRLHPAGNNTDTRTYEVTDGSSRTTANHWGSIDCAIQGSGVWTTDGRIYRADVPGAFVQADAVTGPSFVFVDRVLNFNSRSEFQLAYSNESPEIRDGQHVNFSQWSRATDWGASTTFVTVPDQIVAFGSSSKDASYQRNILWIGFACAAIATLLLSAAKLGFKMRFGSGV